MTNDVQVEPTLYILMRTDLDSMNAGKAMAQASHASNQIIHLYPKNTLLKNWQKETEFGFGTVIVLAINGEMEMLYYLNKADALKQYGVDIITGVVKDETYPVRDGLVTHLISIITCGYVLLDRSDALSCNILTELDLHD